MSNIVTKAAELIYRMDNDQLNEICEAIKLKRQHLTKQAIRRFVKGDHVQFVNRTGGRVNGTVVKVNIKYVIVDAHIGGNRYKVPASMLTLLSEVGA